MKINNIVDKKMPSISEWMEKIHLPQIEKFREEDNNKRDRLEILYKTIGLQYDRPEKLLATDITKNTKKFIAVFQKRKNEKCALRLVPKKANLPKLRVRGKTLKENLKWFFKQKINPDKYKVEIIPHCDSTIFSAIFLIGDGVVWGEITPGPHWQLTQGFYSSKPVVFYYNFKKWHFPHVNKRVISIIQKSISMLKVQKQKQRTLKNKLRAEFTKSGHIKGYFEFVVWPKTSISFIDYNRIIYKLLKNIKQNTLSNLQCSHICASPGIAQGKARIVKNPHQTKFKTGEILVCLMTTADYLLLMKKSAGIITEQGNLLSHAAIVSRELKKPCLVGVKNATKKFKNGDLIKIDANKGLIKIL